ncbi:restriction endonuclease subunit S [Algibacillus agarilyticus]|uniref:restriction endonuclease subunit S n=1 Tax=Algibacillus agarilyticus TaxID=2234133 RepID=UPI000DD0E01D|nr:restriction endonuclease subunit S [Algibacillus agarilyticus]
MGEVNLPEVWCLPSFDNVVLNVNGARRPVSLKVREGIKGEYPYYGATGQIDTLNDFTHEGEHILIGEDGANLLSKSKDLAFIVDGQFWVNNHAHAVKCIAEMPAKFVASYINSLDLSPWVSGSAQPKLTKGNLARIPMPLPPLAEQKVIADKLDTLLAQVETTKARLDRIPQILKTFRQSVLAAAVIGKLTEEWRGAKKVSFNPARLKAITAISGGKTPSKSNSNYWEGGDIPWVSPKDMKTDLIASSQDKITKEAIDTGGMKLVPSNSILVVTRSGILAHSFPVARTLAPVTINQDIKALVPNLGFISPEFLFYLLKGLERRILEECSKAGTTVSSVETSLLMNLEFELPSLEEQTEIVRRVEELFAFADSIEQKANAALERVSNLTQSILAKAFRGELTADWRAANPDLITGENSAEALLKKIKAEREALASKKKPKKKAAVRKKA